MAGFETEELLRDIELSYKIVEQLEIIEERTVKINRKPIRLPIGFHIAVVTMFIVVIGGGFLLDQIGLFVDYKFFVTLDTLWIYLSSSLVGYPLLVYLFNLYVRAAKRWLYRAELEKMKINSNILIDKMQKTSMIPADYWATTNLIRMKRYIMNKRAENLKEALNLLESELRDEYVMRQFGIAPFREWRKKEK